MSATFDTRCWRTFVGWKFSYLVLNQTWGRHSILLIEDQPHVVIRYPIQKRPFSQLVHVHVYVSVHGHINCSCSCSCVCSYVAWTWMWASTQNTRTRTWTQKYTGIFKDSNFGYQIMKKSLSDIRHMLDSALLIPLLEIPAVGSSW